MKPLKNKRKVSGWWWLLPIFFGFLGGVVAWAFNRKKDNEKAILILIVSIGLTVVSFLIISFIAGLLFGIMTLSRTMEIREELYFCRGAMAQIQRGYYDSVTNELTIALFNTGDVNLEGFVLWLEYENGSTKSVEFKNLKINSLDIETVTVSTDDTLEVIRMLSIECRGVQDFVTRDDIEGLGFFRAQTQEF